jgi:hypothetical protein
MLQLKCPAQNYAWGRKAGTSNGRKGSTVSDLETLKQVFNVRLGGEGLAVFPVY